MGLRRKKKMSLVDSVRLGVAIALVGPAVVYCVYLLCTGTALVDLPLALLNAAAETALGTLNLAMTHPLQALLVAVVTSLLGRFAFGRRH